MAGSAPSIVKHSRKRRPLRLRLQILLGKWLCDGQQYRPGRIFFLPRNRIAKLYTFSNELEAMEFVRRNTSIRVPRVYKAYTLDDGSQHLVMERLPGRLAAEVLKDWTPEQADAFGRELAEIITQLRDIKRPASFSGKLIGSTSGGSNHEDRLSCHPFGPFASVTAFHTYLRFGRPLEHWEDRPEVVKVHIRPEDDYTVKFTHADLVPKNIIVDDDANIVAVIDWEYAGWYPEYWEYTKAFYCEMRPFYDNFYRAFETQPAIHKYPDELACELAIWMRMSSPYKYCDPPWQPGDDDKPKAAIGAPTTQNETSPEGEADNVAQDLARAAPASTDPEPGTALHT